MAKDGTNRGGRRPRSGPNKEALADKVMKGREAKVMRFPIEELEGENLPEGTNLQGEEMPKPSEYLAAMQRSIKDSNGNIISQGRPLGADLIFTEIYTWLRARKCDKFINPRQVEQYSELMARAIQCSEALSKYGLIGKHPTTGAAIQSPYVDAELKYIKQAHIIWVDIFQIVKENSMEPYEGMPTGDDMESLIFGRKPKW